MSEQATPSVETVEIVATAPMIKAWEKVQNAEGQVLVMTDKFRVVAKTESAKEKWSKKQLNSVLLDMGVDKSRASEIATWVFPNNVANRALLDEIAAYNVKQTDLKKRIGKEAVLSVSRSEVPRSEKTIEEFQATLAAEKAKAATTTTSTTTSGTAPEGETEEQKKTREARPPGSEVAPHGDGTASAAARAGNANPPASEDESPETVTRRLQDYIAAAMNYAKAHDYDLADFSAEVEVVAAIVKIEGFTPSEE